MGQFKDLTGQQFGYWTVLYRAENKGDCVMWHCRCKCGKEKDVASGGLLSGNSSSCGCKRGDDPKYIGKKFGKLTVLSYFDSYKGHRRYKCRCDCGNERIMAGTDLKKLQKPSCEACKIPAHFIHGMEGTRIHYIWMNMLGRCANPRQKGYGAKGIKVCEEWKTFTNFYEWAMNNGYRDDLSIDRINVNGNYEPDNCRWADSITQGNNRECVRMFEYNGKTQSLPQWSRELGMNLGTLNSRYDRGWSVQEMFEIPIQKLGANQFSTKRPKNKKYQHK